uniref:Proteoglycan 3, pro eosinophil major basic protein 2 n=1 Tax=Aquila chrysaetos chrysaetos TaxID=223781 RepID=A0A663FHE8_AQUCH
MQPCLLLVLALLGTASASHSGECPPRCPPRGDTVGTPWGPLPEVDEAALEVPEEDARCPLQSETQAFNVANPLGASTFRYVIVTRCQSFHKAQRICAQCYRGQLASIHSYSVNSLLRRQAQLSTNRGQVWIGAITEPGSLGELAPRGFRVGSLGVWVWSLGQWVLLGARADLPLPPADGRWRSVRCRVRLPFICKY